MQNSYCINAHSHLLPYPNQIPSFMKDKKIFWIDEEQQFMYQDNWKRPITDRSFFLKEKLVWMQKHQIDHAVVLTLSQLYGNGLSKEDTIQALQFQNNFNASVQAEHPTKFTCGFVVNPAQLEFSLQEIKRCVEELNLSLVCLPTHYKTNEGNWKVIFNPENERLFKCINAYNLAVEIHPYDGEKFIELENSSWRFHLVWMLAQCADAYHFLTLYNYPNLYPNMRVCFAHGGQLAQMNIGRRVQGYLGRPDLFKNQTNPQEFTGHTNIFFDTLLHDEKALQLLIERQGASQVVFGLDDPYPLGEMENEVQQSYPKKLLKEALKHQIINKKEYTNITHKNVIQWLVGNNEKHHHHFLQRITPQY